MFLVSLLLAPGVPTGVTAAGDDRVVVLPPLEVAAELQTNPWRYLAVPGIEVLSSCSESTTRAFIQAEYRVERLFAALVPEEFQVQLAVPKVVILSEQKRTLSASQNLVAGFGGDSMNASASEPKVQFMPNLRLNDPDAVVVFAMIDEERFRPDQLGLTAEYVRFILDRRTPPLPAWLVNGLSVLATRMTFSRDTITFTEAEWISPAETEAVRRATRQPPTLLTLCSLFEQPRPTEAAAAQLWRSQAALFIRWAFDGTDARRAAFWKFVGRVNAAPAGEDVFVECFGRTYDEVFERLLAYLPSAVTSAVYFQPDNIPALPPYRLQLATDAEIARLKGDWERLEIAYVRAYFPQYAARYEEQATRTLARYATAQPRDPRLLAVLGLHACDLGRDDEARPYLEAAVEAQVVRPRVYFELARIRYTTALTQPAGSTGQLSSEQINGILHPLREAHRQSPPLPQTYALIANVWNHTGIRLGPAHFALLDEALGRFPTQPNLLYQVAALKLLHGANAEAAILIQRGLALSSHPTARAGFEKLQMLLKSAR